MTLGSDQMNAESESRLQAEIYKNLSVLVVDDDLVMRRVLSTILREMGFQRIYDATTGHEAVARSQEVAPDLILLDIEMPGLNGIEALAQLRSLHTQTTIVIVTGATTAENVRQSIAGRADGMIAKPLSVAKVELEIVRLVRQRAPNVPGVIDAREQDYSSEKSRN